MEVEVGYLCSYIRREERRKKAATRNQQCLACFDQPAREELRFEKKKRFTRRRDVELYLIIVKYVVSH
jgi:hypothetical protein